jgi:hypothetical protein
MKAYSGGAAVVSSFASAARATLALNLALCFLRFLLISDSSLRGLNQSLAHCPNFGDHRRWAAAFLLNSDFRAGPHEA